MQTHGNFQRLAFRLSFLLRRGVIQQPVRLHTTAHELQGCYNVLGVSGDCEMEEVRESYLRLAKQYHPDSGSVHADATKFAQIDSAYKTIVRRHGKKELDEEIHEAGPEIEHTAPQHRHYLNYEGVGFGTPSNRQKQYQNYQVMRASENIMNYRTSKLSASYSNTPALRDIAHARKKKITNAIERLVEDMIIESMSKGEFDDLPGKGKPLPSSNYNPMIDVTTHNLNRILIENGLKPEWVLLEQEISSGLSEARRKLYTVRVEAGPEPLSTPQQYKWDKGQQEFREQFNIINKKIAKFNMVVPSMQQQIIPYNIEKSLQRVIETYNENVKKGQISNEKQQDDFATVYKPLNSNKIPRLKDIVKDIKALFSSV